MNGYTQYIESFLADSKAIIDTIDVDAVAAMVELIRDVQDREGRLFFLGVGGGAGHASHAVNDFRKIAGIESYTPTDNVSELTARINDDGWDSSYEAWLAGSHHSSHDAVFVFSVGGGDAERGVSVNIVRAVAYAKQVGARVLGVVGRDGGYTARVADACLVIAPVRAETVTPQTEGFQALIWHLIVSHPEIQRHEMKWESTDPGVSRP